MEGFFQYDTQDYTSWFQEAVPLINQSAFVNYENGASSMKGLIGGSSNRNIHKRMMEMLIKRRPIPVASAEPLPDRERCQRHMISERMRREKQKQCYLGLHSLLPSGTKSDKNSIIQSAVKKIEELERAKLELERKNSEVEGILSKIKCGEEVVEEGAKIKLKVAQPSSGIDSVLEVLKCLKETGTQIRAIQSTISAHELSAILEVETKIGAAAQVEMAVQRTLFEVEKKFRFHPAEGKEIPKEAFDFKKGWGYN